MKLDVEVLLEQRREERNNTFWKYQRRVIETSHSRLNLQTPYSIEVEALLGYRKPLKRQLAKRRKNRDFGPKDKTTQDNVHPCVAENPTCRNDFMV